MTPLSPRQSEVTQLWKQGLTRGQMAERLGISPFTVRNLMHDARAKLGVKTRKEMRDKLAENGMRERV